MFFHICETFYLVGVEHNNIKPSGTTILEKFEKLSVNTIEGTKVKREDARAMVRPMSPRTTPKNWTAINILTVFLLSQ